MTLADRLKRRAAANRKAADRCKRIGAPTAAAAAADRAALAERQLATLKR